MCNRAFWKSYLLINDARTNVDVGHLNFILILPLDPFSNLILLNSVEFSFSEILCTKSTWVFFDASVCACMQPQPMFFIVDVFVFIFIWIVL